MRARGLGLALAAIGALLAPRRAAAQEWLATARVGRVTYDGGPASSSTTSSVVLGAGRAGARDWLGASLALPLTEDPFWAQLSGWRRFATRGRAGLLLDLSAHAYLQRERTEPPAPAPGPLPLPITPLSTPDRSGEGAGGEAMAGLFAAAGPARLEARGGVAAQASRLGDADVSRTLPTAEARVSLAAAQFTLRAESRAWFDDGAAIAYAGAGAEAALGPVALGATLGRWVEGGPSGAVWTAAAALRLREGLHAQAGARGRTLDPLYLATSETSYWAGLAVRLGGPRRAQAPRVAREGSVVLALAARHAGAAPSVAGDFTDWKPVPMTRDGGRWVHRATLRPGVYEYAFVGADGRWFVPAGTPGRKDDGMGGHVAVLVVR